MTTRLVGLMWVLVASASFAQEQDVAEAAEAASAETEVEPAPPPPPPPPSLPRAATAASLSAARDDLVLGVHFLGPTSSIGPLVSNPAAPAVSDISFGYLVSDTLALKWALGFVLGASTQGGDPSWGFNVGVGADLLFRSPRDRIRPLFGVDLRFHKLLAPGTDAFGVSLDSRFGAEFFATRWLALRVAAGLGFAANFQAQLIAVGLVPFSVGANFYF